MEMWVLGLGVVVAAVTVAAVNNNQVPKSGFSCEGRITGYYADVQSGCQLYHMCDGLGRQFSYTCPNATLFQQRMLICDHWYMVNCSKSESDYAANSRIGRKMPFVDDSESNPYHRTPRPDLLSHPSQSEYDIIYRTGKAQFGTNFNLVGAETDKNGTTSSTDEPKYSLPSHWSTEYDQRVTTSKPAKLVFNTKKDNGNVIKRKPFGTVMEVPVNYKSSFKATTPVFPLSVEPTSEAPADAGLVPPLPYQMANNKATIKVNFQSDFQATTPVYPTSVDIVSEEPAEVGVLPPNRTTADTKVPSLVLDFQPPVVDTSFDPKQRRPQEAVLPSKFYQPPKFEPDFTEDSPATNKPNKAIRSHELDDLRKKFLIPDYEFPLESVSRPSYDTVLTSFQADGVPSEKK